MAPSYDRFPPVHRISLKLRLTRDTSFPREHGGVLRGLVSRALGQHDLPAGLIPFAGDSGRVSLPAGAIYTFQMTLVGNAGEWEDRLIAGLVHLGAKTMIPQPVLGGNFEVVRVQRLPIPDLKAEIRAIQGLDPLRLVLESPLRLERPVELRRRGGKFFDRSCFPAATLLDRIWRRNFSVVQGRYPASEELTLAPPIDPELEADPSNLFWVDVPVRGTRAKARPYTLGGVKGRVTLRGVPDSWIPTLVLGSYLHVGKSTGYGLGRYVLESSGANRRAFDSVAVPKSVAS